MTMDQPNLLKMLSATRFAAGLSHEHLACLCRAGRLVKLSLNQLLFREGDTEDEVFVISSGHVRLAMNIPGRGDVPFLTAGPGDFVGWSGLISDGRMTATATTVDETTLIALSGKRLQELCNCEKDLGYVLLRRVSQVLSQRLLSTRLQMLDLFEKERTQKVS